MHVVCLHTGIRIGIHIQSMGTEPHTEESFTHRPLPSVDLALLPHERRAVRIRNALGIGIVLFIIGTSVTAYLLVPMVSDIYDKKLPYSISLKKSSKVEKASTQNPNQQDNNADLALPDNGMNPEKMDEALLATLQPEVLKSNRTDETEQPSNTTEPIATKKTRRRFGKARGFREGLSLAGASAEEANELIAALEKLIDFRHCRPEHELVFERDINNKLVQFEYHVSSTDIYRATRSKQGKLVGHKVEIPIEKRIFAKGGYVSKSLRQALVAADFGMEFSGIFVEVFEGRIDFRKNTRERDSFRAIADKEYINGTFLRIGTVHALEYDSQLKGKHRAFWYQPKRGRGDFYDTNGRTMQGGWLRTPVRYDHISSKFSYRRRHPILKRIVPHMGIDYAASPGTTVTAAADGVVTFAGYKGANGNLIALRHKAGYETFYAHLLRIFKGIRSGAKITQRQPIGSVGSTGRSTGPHLHFGLKRHSRFIDPAAQLNGPGTPLPASELPRFRKHKRRLLAELEKIPIAEAPQASGLSDIEHTEPAGYPLGSESL